MKHLELSKRSGFGLWASGCIARRGVIAVVGFAIDRLGVPDA